MRDRGHPVGCPALYGDPLCHCAASRLRAFAEALEDMISLGR